MSDDRSTMRVYGSFHWRGGTLRGNANVDCYGPLDMDGPTKYIAGGLQVCVWMDEWDGWMA